MKLEPNPITSVVVTWADGTTMHAEGRLEGMVDTQNGVEEIPCTCARPCITVHRRLTGTWELTVKVDNRRGGGTVGWRAVAEAAPDRATGVTL